MEIQDVVGVECLERTHDAKIELLMCQLLARAISLHDHDGGDLKQHHTQLQQVLAYIELVLTRNCGPKDRFYRESRNVPAGT